MTPPLRLWLAAHRQSLKAAARRAALDLGASKARYTTANATWSRWAEERERLYANLTPDEQQAADRLRMTITLETTT